MKRLRAALVILVAAGLSMAGCEAASDSPLANEPTTVAPQYSNAGGVNWGLARAQFRQQGEFTSAVIGPSGGWLRVGDNFLEVRAGAVASPTRFVMQQRDGDHFVLDLHAFRTNGQPVSAFPANTVFLYMTYRDAVLADGERFGIAYIPTEETAQSIVPLQVLNYPSWKLVRANLVHFSTYALIVD